MNNLMTRSFLSYQDLKKEALKDLEAGVDPNVSLSASIEMTEKSLIPFFEEADFIQEEMSSIKDLLTKLQESNQSSKSISNPQSLKNLRSQINSNITLVLKKANLIKERLQSLDRANAANRRLSGFREGTPIDRTRTCVTNGLRKKLKELMMEFQDLRQRMMSEYKETVERRYFTVTGEIPDEEVIEKIIADGKSEEFLKNAMSMEVVHEIQDRYDAAKEIEKSLLELHQVFLDMAVMVEAQGEKMDDIEHHVSSASHYVRDGTKELRTAKKYQTSSRKWLCIGVILLLIIILVVVIPIITSLSKS